MHVPQDIIAKAIDTAPLNRGLRGADWLTSEGNIPITFENGDIALFDFEGEGVYQIHLLFVSRGKRAIEHVKQAFNKLFTEYNAELIMAMVPDFRRDVKLLARWVGCKCAGMRQTVFGPCELYVMSNAMWKGI